MQAPRLLWRLWRGLARGAGLALGLWAGVAGADITAARYAEPTDRYPHGVLGDDIEYGALILTRQDGTETVIRLPQERVFEDTAPRLVDIDGDGNLEVLTVESHATQGARAALYDETGLITATPYIGTRFRWLAPAGLGAADLDGDGHMEIAYVDRPHLAKTLRIWRYKDGTLTEIVNLLGVTNHRICEPDIAGGIRTCGTGPEIIVADAGWRRLLAVTFDGTALSSTDIGPHRGRDSFAQAMGCKAAK